jgi:hypothetical protein
MDAPETRPSMTRIAAALILFGLAFGYVEGAVVVDLRALYDPLHKKLHPEAGPDDIFPLIGLDELRKEGAEHVHRLVVELIREGATLVMLAAVPCVFARNFRQWIAGFMIGFGVWDLAYYATLKTLLGWPASWLTWDILFLLPVPWTGPVVAPCLVSCSIIGAGLVILRREAIGSPILLRPGHWTAILLGGLVVVVSFCWDSRAVMAGAHPGPFPWWVFGAGEMVGLLAFGLACQGKFKELNRQERQENAHDGFRGGL